ncbi:MAG: immunoglobulin domain-containing protein, partial [Saprospiraceae bacterium]
MSTQANRITIFLASFFLAGSSQLAWAQPVVTITNGASISICAGSSVTLNTSVTSPPPPSYTYLWSTTATSSAISVSTAGTYTVTVTQAGGLTASASIMVAVNALPTAAAGSN